MPPAVEIPKTLKYIIGTSRYVLIDDLDIGIKNFEDLKIGEPVNCKFIHRSREYILKCSIASFILFLFIFIIKYFEGTSGLPRICYANHKLNLAVKTAIREHKTIERHFRLLNNFISKIKRTIQSNRIFANAKCRLRLENITRWGSGFLMLETIRKADGLGLLKNDLIAQLP